MIGVAAKLSRVATTTARTAGLGLISRGPSPPFRLFSANNGPNADPVALQMINYAFSLPRSHKSDESYAEASLVLEQCFSTQRDDNSKGMVLLAMATLLAEREKCHEAIEKLQRIRDLTYASIGLRVAATEALVGLNLELEQDDASSDWFSLSGVILNQRSHSFEELKKTMFALAMLICHMENSCMSLRIYQLAKELYEKAIQGMSDNNDFSDPYNIAACNMAPEEVLLAATGCFETA
ncbi:hypothetical protein F0562_016298 [Nyssa sinensis]|uniref:MalT-like TPR region domain-containing protein n=1 Tax=Nyssa sinensis TaxID=561372 RepID=A0A5J4ZMP1_9ASTE|nr:hypothetical protein F0562_016298 [Nyssa sinensis]